jgi:hypothetical protein
VILQPSYLPWRGAFDQIHRGDVFVFLDDVQYDRRGWRNRNRIKTAGGPRWLTVPVHAKGTHEGLLIKDVKICREGDWQSKHARAIRHSYARSPFFDRVWPILAPFYDRPFERLVDLTVSSTVALAEALGIGDTRFVRSSELGVEGGRTERLLRICQHLRADHYLTGPAARGYLEERRFDDAGITVEYMTYDYPDYEQLHGRFEPSVSVIDLLFMKGPEASRFIWG